LLSLVVLPVFGATATDNIDVQILIPARVGITISNAAPLSFDLTSVAIPATFPAYYFPNGGDTEILMEIFCNAKNGYTLDVTASGDFDLKFQFHNSSLHQVELRKLQMGHSLHQHLGHHSQHLLLMLKQVRNSQAGQQKIRL